MKRTLISIIAFILCIGFLNGQSWISSNRIHGDNSVGAIHTTSGPDGKIVLLGYFSGTVNIGAEYEFTSHGSRDYFVVKFSLSGDVEWAKQLGSSGPEYVLGGICACFDENIYISGGFRNYLFYETEDSLQSNGGWDTFLAKYDASGNLTWMKNIGTGASNQRPHAVKVDKTGDVLLSGFFTDSINFNESTTFYSEDGIDDYFYSKFDPDGNLLWAKQIKSLENVKAGRIFAIDATETSYYFGGFFSDSTIIEDKTLVSINNSYDIHLFKTNLNGDIDWIRTIGGNQDDLTYGIVTDSEENVYLSGYYDDTDTLFVDDSENSQLLKVGTNEGSFDFLVAKYDMNGNLSWINTSGGKATDKLNDISLYENGIIVSGYFADTLFWGGIELTTQGSDDTDMFIGELDPDGNFRSANSYGGINNSLESARSVFYVGTELYTIIRSNSELLKLGGDDYISSNGTDYIVLGIIGCNPISIDNTIYSNVTGCYGDSTGAIQIAASGGFGSPWQYSIDNGLSYQESPYFPKLPIGDYQVLVIDKENCTEVGQVVTLTQPDTLEVQLISSSDITVDADGSIVVGAQGGTSPYTYTLMPDNVLQGYGTFMFARGDSGKYVVQLTDGNLCGPVSTDTIWIQDLSSVGINELGGLMLRVFPNPATDVVTVEMPMEAAEVSMEVLSLTGQIVLSRRAYTTGGVLRETIDVSELADGMYMLRLNGETLKSAFVVN